MTTIETHHSERAPRRRPRSDAEAMPSGSYISIHQLAGKFGVSDRTVRRWVRAGQIPFYRLSARLFRFKVPEVDAAVERLRIPARGESSRHTTMAIQPREESR